MFCITGCTCNVNFRWDTATMIHTHHKIYSEWYLSTMKYMHNQISAQQNICTQKIYFGRHLHIQETILIIPFLRLSWNIYSTRIPNDNISSDKFTTWVLFTIDSCEENRWVTYGIYKQQDINVIPLVVWCEYPLQPLRIFNRTKISTVINKRIMLKTNAVFIKKLNSSYQAEAVLTIRICQYTCWTRTEFCFLIFQKRNKRNHQCSQGTCMSPTVRIDSSSVFAEN